jgi:hypothetical protein
VVDGGAPPIQDAGGTEPLPDAGALDSGSPPTSDCKPGTYEGTFEGEIQILGFISLPIDGEISIGIHTSSAGDDLVIENGTIEGEDQDGNPVHAEVEGTLQCATKKLVGGRLLNGTYTRTGLNMTVNFQGTADATYTPGDSPSVSGTWQTTGGLVERGSGTFEATFAGP